MKAREAFLTGRGDDGDSWHLITPLCEHLHVKHVCLVSLLCFYLTIAKIRKKLQVAGL